MSSIVAIVGRPNVGKSTLFNRLIQRQDAIVDSQSGVTRDRHYGLSFWNGKDFTVIDTGGYMLGGEDNFEKEINHQVIIAVEESDIIIFTVDVETGLNSMDNEISKLLHKSGKQVVLAVNKVDNSKRIIDTSEFFKLGFENSFNISAINGSGTGELLDKIVQFIPDKKNIDIGKDSNFSLGRNLYFHLPLFMNPRWIVNQDDNIFPSRRNFGLNFGVVVKLTRKH